MAAEGIYFKRYCLIISLFFAVFLGNFNAFGQISLGQNGSNVEALHSLGITGSGVNVGMLSSRNVRDDHQAFYKSPTNHNSRVTNRDYSGSGVNYLGGTYPGHDTWVAGIVASRGWTGYTTATGTAPDCNLYSARVVTEAGETYTTDLIEAFEAFIDTYNCRVFVLPLQYSGDTDGSSNLSKMVDYYAFQYNVVLALASGNEYIYPTIFGDAYNGITTGALIDETSGYYDKVGTLSNPGPTTDGRNKPDISAPGSSQVTPHITSTTAAYTTVKDGATSFSCPQTAGIAALLLQYTNSTPDPCDNRNTVIKAVIVNSTFPNIKTKYGIATNPAVNVWDPNRGYGRIDALAAYETLSAGRISKGVPVSNQKQSGWAYDSMTGRQTDTYLISAEKNERLVLTVTWNRKINKKTFPSVSFEEDTPRFNIDLIIKNPSDVNVYADTDTLNNLIKVDLPLDSTGQYKVILTNTTSKSRSYALAFERLETLAGDLNSDFVVNYKDLKQLATDWLGVGLASDIAADPNVNFLDYNAFSADWQSIDSRYYTP
ncbi:MAG: S8 family serine peptidase [Planctomycetaceae bacterium]|nr:S8 family serine peptidase [Planctomycetaceae bacterium]